ncbi:DNA methylase N-4, partial [Pseudomonas aeruginosa]|nr:DNA methylase N-4 [Pseudomonas aeruginosa]
TWLVRQGRAACFAAFGLGKSVMQLEVVRVTRDLAGGYALITIPLGVRQEFYRDAAMLGITVRFIRSFDEVDDPNTIYLTNYETVRDGKLDPRRFSVASLDEASCLRGFGGSKTFREFMALFAGDDHAAGIRGDGVRYRYVATATPSPNEYIELLAYSAFLGVMDVGQAKTRFFKRN